MAGMTHTDFWCKAVKTGEGQGKRRWLPRCGHARLYGPGRSGGSPSDQPEQRISTGTYRYLGGLLLLGVGRVGPAGVGAERGCRCSRFLVLLGLLCFAIAAYLTFGHRNSPNHYGYMPRGSTQHTRYCPRQVPQAAGDPGYFSIDGSSACAPISATSRQRSAAGASPR